MSYTIIDTCIGCAAYTKKCPVECIVGTRKETAPSGSAIEQSPSISD